MKVGIDIRSLSRSLSGVGRYTLEMCKALLKNKELQLYLYSPSKLNSNIDFLEGAYLRCAAFQGGVARQLWGESYLIQAVKKDHLDV
ncbi:MAG TPA: hypothetical protein VD770_00635, partial [Coxiellaceae bacterium]|nr:hypothetical protein [Coxiellaceae bacterium]